MVHVALVDRHAPWEHLAKGAVGHGEDDEGARLGGLFDAIHESRRIAHMLEEFTTEDAVETTENLAGVFLFVHWNDIPGFRHPRAHEVPYDTLIEGAAIG